MQLPLHLPLCPVLSGVSCWSSGTRCLSPHTHSESQSATHFREVSHWERNTAASHHGSCSTAALPFPCAPWTCQAGTGGHGRPATSFLITQFPFSPYPPWVSGHVLVTADLPVDNLRSREDARQAKEDSIPCQPAAQTGRQSPALAGAKHGLISWQNNSSLCSLFSQNNPLL